MNKLMVYFGEVIQPIAFIAVFVVIAIMLAALLYVINVTTPLEFRRIFVGSVLGFWAIASLIVAPFLLFRIFDRSELARKKWKGEV